MNKYKTEKELLDRIDQIIIANIRKNMPQCSKYFDFQSRNYHNIIKVLMEHNNNISKDDNTNETVKYELESEYNMIKSIIVKLGMTDVIDNMFKDLYKKTDVDVSIIMFINRFWSNYSMPFREICGHMYLIRSVYPCKFHMVNKLDVLNFLTQKTIDSMSELETVNKSKTVWQFIGYIGITVIAGFVYSILRFH